MVFTTFFSCVMQGLFTLVWIFVSGYVVSPLLGGSHTISILEAMD
jgi:hypothetical protein